MVLWLLKGEPVWLEASLQPILGIETSSCCCKLAGLLLCPYRHRGIGIHAAHRELRHADPVSLYSTVLVPWMTVSRAGWSCRPMKVIRVFLPISGPSYSWIGVGLSIFTVAQRYFIYNSMGAIDEQAPGCTM